MNYELAKELKNAGFPQEVKYGDWIYYPDKSCMFIGNSDDMGDTTGGYSFTLGRESTTAKPNRVKVPTLEELIEACGLDLHRIEYDSGKWRAYEQSGLNNLYSEGSTPNEAVARLWLALNPTH